MHSCSSALGLAALVALSVPFASAQHQHASSYNASQDSKLADGCWHVYVDMGTNVGHQIRKVFEPQLYGAANNDARGLYSEAYGDDPDERRNVCAFGFEANPRHCKHLHLLERAYKAHGHRLKIYCPMAVANVDGTVMVLKLAEGVKDEHHDWGATTAQGVFREGAGVNRTTELWNSDHLPRVEVPVPSVDMSAWFLRNVIGRTLPARAPGAKDAAVVAKSDIEFADPPVLARLLLTGVLCQVAVLYSEHMSPEFKVAAPYLFQQANCSSRIVDLDDESGDDSLKLP